MIDFCGAEWSGGLRRILATLGEPDIRCIVGSYCWGDVRVVKNAFPNGEYFARTCAHEHDVNQSLTDVFPDEIPVIIERAKVALLGVMFGAFTGRGHAAGHVGILGIGEEKISTARVIKDPRNLGVEAFGRHAHESLFPNNPAPLV